MGYGKLYIASFPGSSVGTHGLEGPASPGAEPTLRNVLPRQWTRSVRLRYDAERRNEIFFALRLCLGLLLIFCLRRRSGAVAFGIAGGVGAAEQYEAGRARGIAARVGAPCRFLEEQSAVVKIVAKLVGPSVVHIEADVPVDASPQYSQGRHVEEAGSGVIIERKQRFYVLTNRHVVRNAAPEAIRIQSGRRAAACIRGRFWQTPTRTWR